MRTKRTLAATAAALALADHDRAEAASFDLLPRHDAARFRGGGRGAMKVIRRVRARFGKPRLWKAPKSTGSSSEDRMTFLRHLATLTRRGA